jgi:hypothetical protein
MKEPWEVYLEAFEARGRRGARATWNREDLLDAAHEAYRDTADHLAGERRWEEGQALLLGREFGSVVREWLGAAELDWDGLGPRLQAAWQRWQAP